MDNEQPTHISNKLNARISNQINQGLHQMITRTYPYYPGLVVSTVSTMLPIPQHCSRGINLQSYTSVPISLKK